LADKDPLWSTTQYTNLVQYIPSGKYYARIRVCGKLIRKSLKTTKISIAKLRLSDLEKAERQKAENQIEATNDRLTFAQATETYRRRLKGDVSLKPRTRDYHEQRLTALLKSWPELNSMELRRITKTECLNWAAKFGQGFSPTAFNHTVSILRHVIELGVEMVVRYDNPARFIKRLGQNNRPQCVHGHACPQVLEKIDGNFAVVGKIITKEATAMLPPGPGVGLDEGVVEVPRAVMLSAMSEFFATAAT
jgi:hypothetical protein